MNLTKFPPGRVADLLSAIIGRQRAAMERMPFRRLKTLVVLTIDEARMFYAGWKWLERYENWAEEAAKTGKPIGVEETLVTLPQCVRVLGQLTARMSGNESKLIEIRRGDVEALECAATHLDRYDIMLTASRSDARHRRK